jgi:glucose/arabinose dehydrogenase
MQGDRMLPLKMVRLYAVLSFGLLVIAGTAVVVGPGLVARVHARLRPGWLEGPNLTLSPVIGGLKQPTFVTGAPQGAGRLFVLERGGLVRVAQDGQLRAEPFLDLSQDVSLGGEEGLLGFAFDPDFASNGYVYVSYTATDWSVHVVRYTVTSDQPYLADRASAHAVLVVPKKGKYHNSGMIAFGPDRYLYVGIGDDERDIVAQDLGTPYGKILRLDVNVGSAGDPYVIPPTNPFAGEEGVRQEIWAYGLRNPWRFSFDRQSGDLWIGDVHHVDQEQGLNWEVVDFQAAGSQGGVNFGFPMRVFHCADIATCQPPGVTLPLVEYGHDMNCSVIGGYVYRGKRIPALDGVYLYGDLCTGGVFTLRNGVDPSKARVELGYQPIQISSFGEDADGEVYVVDILGGTIYRVEDANVPIR